MADGESDEELRKYIRQMIREEGGGRIGEDSGNDGGGRRGGGGSGGVDLGEFGKFVAAAKGMKEAMTSDVDKALSSAVSNKIVDQVIPSMSPQQRAPSGFLDTGFAIAFAQKLPEQLATLVDVFFNRLGPDRTGKLVDGIQQKFLGGGGNGGTPLREDDVIGALDPDNPAHLHQYMAYRNLNDPDIAKRTLISEKDKIRRSAYSGNVGGGSVGSVGGGTTDAGLIQTLESQNAALKDLIQAKAEDRKVMEALFNEINTLKRERDAEWMAKDFDINEVGSGKNVDDLGLHKKEKTLKEVKAKDESVETEEVSGELVPAVKLEDVVIKNSSEKIEDENVEDGSGNVEAGNVEDVRGKEEDRKTKVVRKIGGSKPKFE
jgi:hypothetical protein